MASCNAPVFAGHRAGFGRFQNRPQIIMALRTHQRIWLSAALLLALLLLGGGACWQLALPPHQEPDIAGPGEIALPAGSRMGGPFSLVDQDGKTVTDRDYRGRWALIYFGYSFCPDVCPTELATMSEALDHLSPALAQQVQPLFITIDPARDTPEQMKNYVPLFHPRLVGLSGTEAQVAPVLREFRVYAVRRDEAGASGYLMDHSSFFYLLAPDGTLQALYRGGLPPEDLATNLRRRLS
jgi:protein SCO1/2